MGDAAQRFPWYRQPYRHAFHEKAQALVKMWFVHLPDVDPAYLPQGIKEFDEYVGRRMGAGFAMVNREIMMENALNASPFPDLATIEEAVNAITTTSRWRITTAPTSGSPGGRCPRSSGDLNYSRQHGSQSYIVRGKGNPESFHSCSHGAGRVMSRGEAFKKITLEEHAKATEGVECRKDKEVIDESPAAYKDVEKVMAAQADLVDIVHTLKQVLCVKG